MAPFFSVSLPKVRAICALRTLGANVPVLARAATKRDTTGNDFFHCKCMLLMVGSGEEPWVTQSVESTGV